MFENAPLLPPSRLFVQTPSPSRTRVETPASAPADLGPMPTPRYPQVPESVMTDAFCPETAGSLQEPQKVSFFEDGEASGKPQPLGYFGSLYKPEEVTEYLRAANQCLSDSHQELDGLEYLYKLYPHELDAVEQQLTEALNQTGNSDDHVLEALLKQVQPARDHAVLHKQEQQELSREWQKRYPPLM